MKIAVKDILYGDDGLQIMSPDGKTPLDLCTAIRASLLAHISGDENMNWQDKLKLGEVAHYVLANDEVEFEAEEISLIKNRAAKTWNIPVVCAVIRIIDPGSVRKR